MRYWILAILLVFTTLSNAQEGEGNSAFAKANSLYTADDYAAAAKVYEGILQSGQHSAEVYFNLGNAYYKMNQVGPAIYNYEKALQLDPSSKDAQNNLRFAQQLRVDAVEEVPTNPFNEFVIDLFTAMSVDNWAYASILLALLSVLFFILYHYAATTGKKRAMFAVFLALLILTVFAVVAAGYSQDLREQTQQAIVYSTETVTRTEPKNIAESSFAIHEGTKVTILEEYESWAKIEVANGSQSWMPLADLKKL